MTTARQLVIVQIDHTNVAKRVYNNFVPPDSDSQHQHNRGEVEQLFQAESYGHQYPCPLYQATDETELPY